MGFLYQVVFILLLLLNECYPNRFVHWRKHAISPLWQGIVNDAVHGKDLTRRYGIVLGNNVYLSHIAPFVPRVPSGLTFNYWVLYIP